MSELVRFSLEEQLDADVDAAIEAADREIREALAGESGGQWGKLRLPLLGDKVYGAIDDAVGAIDPIELFAEAWSQIRELQNLPPNERTFVEVGKFTFDKDLHPVVQVEFAPWVSREIPFVLTLRVTTQAVELEVFDRHIVAVGGGHCEIGFELKYESIDLSGPVKLKRYDLPLTHRFEAPGVPIPGTDPATPAPDRGA